MLLKNHQTIAADPTATPKSSVGAFSSSLLLLLPLLLLLLIVLFWTLLSQNWLLLPEILMCSNLLKICTLIKV